MGAQPDWIARSARIAAPLAVAALLSACATRNAPVTASGNALTATQEAAVYKARAKPNYAPPGPPSDPWGPYITEASQRFDVPDAWIRGVMEVESGGYQFRATGELTTSPVGAMGLMQLMPETYDEMRARYGLGDDAYEPHSNILAGAAYLREMYDAFGSPGMLAAYNAGPARLEDYLTHNRPLPDETRRYVWMIGSRIEGVFPQSRSPAEQLAVNQMPIDIPPGPRWVRHTVVVASRARRRGGHEAPVRYAAADRRLSLHGHGRAGHVMVPVEVAEAPEIRVPIHAGHVRLAMDVPVVHRSGGLHLVTPAMAAESIHMGGGHGWGVQVGAFGNKAQARAAAGAARGAVDHASPEIAAVQSGRATLYRARLGGLTHEAAVHACAHLSARHKGSCLIVSPASR